VGKGMKRAACGLVVVTALLIVGTGTSLADPSKAGISVTGNELIVESPETDTTPHDISVSFSRNTYTVTDSAGTIIGDPGNDGLGGCNQINGTTISCPGREDDIILIGGAGPDHLRVLSANTGLRLTAYTGGGGDDTITAVPAATRLGSRLNGGLGNDILVGGSGRDFIRGGPGDDRLFGRAGNDVLNPGPGNDVVRGGPGRDRKIG
jgi:Ca2+-binding RTX toxin-like protein